jgi:drug/metabolite transporter (DMT)-like permease
MPTAVIYAAVFVANTQGSAFVGATKNLFCVNALATATMISIIIILPMFVFGFDLTFWDEKSNEIVYLSILIFGPYFIGKEWDQIQNIVSKIFKN